MSDNLASGTYEILRGRLREAAEDLRARFGQLNAARSEVFGNIESRLVGTAHISTDHNCIPRDLLASGGQLLLGYNVQFGLRTDIRVEDVFSLYRLEGDVAHPLPLSNLFDEQSRRDFSELYRYYKNTSFSRFYLNGPHVHFVFQVGRTPNDIKTFKWLNDGSDLRYLDNRSEHEVRTSDQNALQWRRATRDQHRSGIHPHISIEDQVFVECVGGDLTIKIEDNTEDGSGIYCEPVENLDQTLDDAEVFYCLLDQLVLLKIRPYQEARYRYLVFSRKQSKVLRLDAIEHACVLLPHDHGIIFPDGFVLQTGEYKLFDHGLEGLRFDRLISAPNGEDTLFLFNDLHSGTYLQLRYNVIRQSVDVPLVSHGQAFFEDGRMVAIRSQDHPQRHHALQIWQTPFVGTNFQMEVTTDSVLYKIGNRDLVQCMSECQELLALIDKDDSFEGLYLDLAKLATNILDGYHWITREETYSLNVPLEKIREVANAAVEEFEKVVRVRSETESKTRSVMQAVEELLRSVQRSAFESIEQFVGQLAKLREQRGHALGLRELRFVDLEVVGALESSLAEAVERLGERCVQFLLNPSSLKPYQKKMEEINQRIDPIRTAAEARTLESEVKEINGGLELLIETVSMLKIDDLTQRTAIVDRCGNLLAELNRIRSRLKARLRDLLSGEMESDFASQSRLLDQAVAGALETADTPEKVDEALTRMMLQMEELEGRFAEFDRLLIRLAEKRESLLEAFESRRNQLVEARSRRAESLATAADRILQGISARAQRLNDADALRGYLAADPMVDKLRQIAGQLAELGDTVRMDDVLTRLKAVGDDAIRQLRDRQELFAEGTDLIRLGKHQFQVNRQPIELTTVVREGQIQLHLTATQFFQPLQHPSLEESRDLWQQLLPSETPEIYRAEFLADLFCKDLRSKRLTTSVQEFLAADPDRRVDWLRDFMADRHDEGYARGVHDRDASRIAGEILQTEKDLGLLAYSPEIRGLAGFAWQYLVPPEQAFDIQTWLSSLFAIAKILPAVEPSAVYIRQLSLVLAQHAKGLFDKEVAGSGTTPDGSPHPRVEIAASYLFEHFRWIYSGLPTLEQKAKLQRWLVSPRAISIERQLREHLPSAEREILSRALQLVSDQPVAAWNLALDAVDGYLRSDIGKADQGLDPSSGYRCEVAMMLLDDSCEYVPGASAMVAKEIDGIAGDHDSIQNGKLRFHFHYFGDRLLHYQQHALPRFRALRDTKHRLLNLAESELRISEFKASVLTSFVRNRLIDQVYLPLIGDNLAKQLGAAGDSKRSDRMGLLLLISPPGYGKTTLMEYVANRLGLVFVKVNGPALGHSITSLDPAEARNASAREEVKRINLALEMGDNVMLYLDDIQHCHPELLQKFIPLCDATRRIEGVWNDKPKTYDLRGRKVAVVMAGNPYTESGNRFQIPDMLANRADVYNLGEIIGDSQDAFELSYIENCLTSNLTLQPLARTGSRDQLAMIRAAQRGSSVDLELESNLPPDQVKEMLQVLSKLLRLRDVILQINRAYIRSAAQADAYRTEPPFKLQGSYRNMNRIAERVVPVMNDDELQRLIISNYEQDAQTLTRDGEANLLKFKEILGIHTEADKERWESIKYAYMESVRMQGIEGDDTSAHLLRSMTGLRDGLESIRRTMAQAISSSREQKYLDVVQESSASISGRIADLSNQISEVIRAGSEKIEWAGRQVPEQRVLVQHSVPRVMTDLIQSQFQLLYDGLRPVLEASAGSRNQLEALKRSIDACLQQYQELQGEIEKAQGRQQQDS
jgi:hypothetical protein